MLSSAKIDEINMVPVLCKNAPYCQTSVPLLHLSSHEDNCPVSISAPALLSGPPSHPNAFISHHPPHQAFSVPCSSCNVFMHPSQSILSYVCSTACLERPYALILSLLEENNHLHDFITEKNLDYILPRSAAVYAAFDFIQSKNSRPPPGPLMHPHMSRLPPSHPMFTQQGNTLPLRGAPPRMSLTSPIPQGGALQQQQQHCGGVSLSPLATPSHSNQTAQGQMIPLASDHLLHSMSNSAGGGGVSQPAKHSANGMGMAANNGPAPFAVSLSDYLHSSSNSNVNTQGTELVVSSSKDFLPPLSGALYPHPTQSTSPSHAHSAKKSNLMDDPIARSVADTVSGILGPSDSPPRPNQAQNALNFQKVINTVGGTSVAATSATKGCVQQSSTVTTTTTTTTGAAASSASQPTLKEYPPPLVLTHGLDLISNNNNHNNNNNNSININSEATSATNATNDDTNNDSLQTATATASSKSQSRYPPPKTLLPLSRTAPTVSPVSAQEPSPSHSASSNWAGVPIDSFLPFPPALMHMPSCLCVSVPFSSLSPLCSALIRFGAIPFLKDSQTTSQSNNNSNSTNASPTSLLGGKSITFTVCPPPANKETSANFAAGGAVFNWWHLCIATPAASLVQMMRLNFINSSDSIENANANANVNSNSNKNNNNPSSKVLTSEESAINFCASLINSFVSSPPSNTDSTSSSEWTRLTSLLQLIAHSIIPFVRSTTPSNSNNNLPLSSQQQHQQNSISVNLPANHCVPTQFIFRVLRRSNLGSDKISNPLPNVLAHSLFQSLPANPPFIPKRPVSSANVSSPSLTDLTRSMSDFLVYCLAAQLTCALLPLPSMSRTVLASLPPQQSKRDMVVSLIHTTLLHQLIHQSPVSSRLPANLLRAFIEFSLVLAPDAPTRSHITSSTSANSAANNRLNRQRAPPYLLDTLNAALPPLLSPPEELTLPHSARIAQLAKAQAKTKLGPVLCIPCSGWWAACDFEDIDNNNNNNSNLADSQTRKSNNATTVPSTASESSQRGDIVEKPAKQMEKSMEQLEVDEDPPRKLARVHSMHMYMQFVASQMNLLDPASCLPGDQESLALYESANALAPAFLKAAGACFIRPAVSSLPQNPFTTPLALASLLPVPLFAALLALTKNAALVRLASFQQKSSVRPFWTALSAFCASALEQTPAVSAAPEIMQCLLADAKVLARPSDSPAAVLDTIIAGLAHEIQWTSLQDVSNTPPSMSPIFRLFGCPCPRNETRFIIGASPAAYVAMAADAAKLPVNQRSSLILQAPSTSLATELLRLPVARLANAPAYLFIALPAPTTSVIANIKSSPTTAQFAQAQTRAVSLIPPRFIPLTTTVSGTALMASQDAELIVADTGLVKQLRYSLTTIVASSVSSASTNNTHNNKANNNKSFGATTSNLNSTSPPQSVQTVQLFSRESSSDDLQDPWSLTLISPKFDAIGAHVAVRTFDNLSAVIKQLSTINGGPGVTGASLLLYTLEGGNSSKDLYVDLSPATLGHWINA